MFDSQLWVQFFTQFHFIRPFWLLALVPMLLLLWLRWREESQPSWQEVLPAHLRKALTIGDTGWRKQLPLKLLVMIVTLAIVVCSGPSWQREASPFGEDRAAMLVVLDSSDTMLETDVAPSRLERAKHKIRDLLALRSGGSTGLLVFAGSGHTAMPLTQDVAVFAPFLAAIEPSIMPESGKSADTALALIDDQLNQQPGSTVLLVSDGVTPSAIDAYQRFFAERPYQLVILAAGNEQVASTSQAKSPLDLHSLNQLADAVGGRLVEMSIDESDVEQINRYVERNMQMNGDSAMPWQDMGYWLLIPVMLLMLLWFRKGWLVQWCVVLTLLGPIGLPSPVLAQTVSTHAESPVNVEVPTMLDEAAQWWWDLWLTPDQQGQRWFNRGDYLRAAKHYQSPLHKGVAYYYAAEYKLAHTAFLSMQNDQRDESHYLGLYNAASALARQREYLAARNLLNSLLDDENLPEALRKDVLNNRNVLAGIVEEINRLSESQTSVSDGLEDSYELSDNPQTADGAEENTVEELLNKESLNAREILGSDELADKWLKRVEADPKRFLRSKFYLQQQSAQGESQ